MTGAWLGWLLLGTSGVVSGCEDTPATTGAAEDRPALQAQIPPEDVADLREDEAIVQAQAAPADEGASQPSDATAAPVSPDEPLAAPRRFPGVRKTTPPDIVADAPPQPGGFQTAQVRPGDTSAATVDFIVKVRDPAIRTDVTDVFRRDRDSAVAAFAAWSVGTPFEGFELVGATYSGEIIIHMAADAPEPVKERLMSISARALAEQISALENVVYCDPDYTARPG